MDAEMLQKIDELLQQLVGELVWSVRRGYGTYLTMQFGCPHRVVREPMEATNGDAVVARVLGRRNVSIVGDWSLWIRDSQWSIVTKDGVADLNTSEAFVHEMLRNLDGQKVSAVRRNDETVLEFDLGATLRLGKSIFPDEATSVLWMLSRFEKPSICLLNDGSTDG
jgi:hypothetical protein